MPIGYQILIFEGTTIKSLINNGEMKIIDSELRNSLVSYNIEKEGLLFVLQIFHHLNVILRDISMDGGSLISKLKNQKELAKFIRMEERYDKLVFQFRPTRFLMLK